MAVVANEISVVVESSLIAKKHPVEKHVHSVFAKPTDKIDRVPLSDHQSKPDVFQCGTGGSDSPLKLGLS